MERCYWMVRDPELNQELQCPVNDIEGRRDLEAGCYQVEHESAGIVMEDRANSVNNLLESLPMWSVG